MKEVGGTESTGASEWLDGNDMLYHCVCLFNISLDKALWSFLKGPDFS